MQKNETAKNHSPLSFIGGKYPPRHFGGTLTFYTLQNEKETRKSNGNIGRNT